MDAHERIPQAPYERLINIQDQGQMIITNNTKFIPNLDTINNDCIFIRLTRRTD